MSITSVCDVADNLLMIYLPYDRTLVSGHVSPMEIVCYIWDQFVIISLGMNPQGVLTYKGK